MKEDEGPFRRNPSFQKHNHITKKYNAFLLHSTCYGSTQALEEISTQNGPFKYNSNSMSLCVSQ